MRSLAIRTALWALPVLALGSCDSGTGGPTTDGGGSPSGAPAGDLTPSAGTRPLHPDEIRGEMTTAFKPAPAGATPVRGDTAVIALLSDIDSLNPFTSTSREAQEVQDLIFPRLMLEEADYYKGPPTFTPRIAESWEFGADGLSIRFKLRECEWSDGTPITGEDIRFSWEAARNPDVAWVSASIVDFIRDIEIHSPRDFTVHYTQESPYQLMDINDVQIVPKHVFGKVPFDRWQGHDWREQSMVCGGPFRLEEYVPNQQIVLGRNPHYWEPGKPYLEKVVFRVVGDLRTQISALLAGDIDVMISVIPKDARRVLEAPHLQLYSYVTRTYGYIGWNCGHPLFSDRRVRRAMTHAIDRENIVESIFYGFAKVAAPQIISSMWASNKNIQPLPYDPDRAVELLEEAGWKRNAEGLFEKDGKPFRFTIFTNAGNEVRRQICVYAQSNLRDIGVDMQIQVMDFNQMSEQLKAHKFESYAGVWGVATKVDNKPIWHSSAANGRFNFVDYKDDRVDEIIDTARVMKDFEAAKKLWDEFQEILDRDQPYTMVYEPRGLVGIHRRFQNVKVTSLRQIENIHEWWVPKSEQKYRAAESR